MADDDWNDNVKWHGEEVSRHLKGVEDSDSE